MTRNDFEVIADVLAQAREWTAASAQDETCRCAIAAAFADRLALINPRFNRAMFLRACGVDA